MPQYKLKEDGVVRMLSLPSSIDCFVLLLLYYLPNFIDPLSGS